MARARSKTARIGDRAGGGNPDFVRYAEAYGAKGSRVATTEDLLPTLEAAFAGSGVHLVTVPIDYSENMRVLVDELRDRVPTPASEETEP